jgi:hypothetical protein
MDRRVVLLKAFSVRGPDRGLGYAYKVILVSPVTNEVTNNEEKPKEDKG